MKITIIGNGNMAKGIATRLLAGGHTVNLHVRDTAKGQALADELSGDVTVNELGSPADKVVIVTTPYSEFLNVAKQYNDFAGNIVLDITNPIDFATFQLIPEAGRSGAEDLAAALPEATIIKAFNTVVAGALMAGEIEGKSLDVFIAGDDQEAKTSVSEFINDSGMRAIDVGPLSNARHLEGLGLIHISVQDQLGTNWMSAIKILG